MKIKDIITNLFKIKFLFLSSFIVLTLNIYAQKSYIDVNNKTLEQAIDLFEKEKYNIALQLLEQLENNKEISRTEKITAAYFSFLCSKELFHNNTQLKGKNFIFLYPESPYVNNVLYNLGNIEYLNKNYKNAISWFTRVNKNNLSEDEQEEYYFKTGYSYLMIDSLDKARKFFYEIKDIDTRYTSAAIYFYSHIAYLQKNYETAIEGFKRISDEEEYTQIIPYYITQCLYYQQKYEEIISYSPTYLDSIIESRKAEMAKIIADAYYNTNQYEKALEYYKIFFNGGKNFQNKDYYQSGYCYYYLKDYSSAIPFFEKAANDNSIVGQSASYHLGDCYIRNDMKDKALLAFSNASKLDFDQKIKEDAAFNYAVLSYQLGNTPFNSSIKALSDYINSYPNSQRTEEAYNYLITACLNTHNYQEALNYLEKVKTKTNKIREAYQKASFFRGLELYNNLDFTNAEILIEKALRYADCNQLIAARSYYWIGEINYRKKEFDDALDNYLLFYNSPLSKKTDEYNTVLYNIAYCYFNKKDYPKAKTWFLKYLDNSNNKNKFLINDANNRVGDCLFASSQFKEAITYYSKVAESNSNDRDYAMFQQAFSYGLLGDHNRKINILENLIGTMPQSNYCDDAYYEKGMSYVAIQRPSDATKQFKILISKYPQSSFVKKAWLQLGIIDYNSGQNDSALVKYKKVINDYPGTVEARSALNGIKNIYVELNDVDSYLKYAGTVFGGSNIAQTEQDSLLYYSAEKQYTNMEWQKACLGFEKYLQKFPNGNFYVSAHYFKADCHNRLEEFDKALEDYKAVINAPRNNYTDPSLSASAKIYLNKKDYKSALDCFIALQNSEENNEYTFEARYGACQCYYFLAKYLEVIEMAKKVLNTEGLAYENERKVRYYMAKSYIATNEEKKALENLQKLAKDVKNIEGAESKYLIAEIFFKQNQLDNAIKEIFNFADLNTPHQYWLAKAYILLAKIYFQKNKSFQSLKTLDSIIENYDNKDDGIINEAKDLKNQIEIQTNNPK